MLIFGKTHSCKNWRFLEYHDPKVILWKQNFHQNLLFDKSNALQNLMRCKTFFFEIWHLLKFRFKIWRFVKNGSKSDAFDIPDSKYDAWYNKWFKNWILSKVLIQKIFFKGKKNNFFLNNFSKNAQKANFDVFGVSWPDKWFFESELSNNVRFRKKQFFHRNLMRC